MLDQNSTSTKPISQIRDYYPALDGIRGLAILMVLFSHNFSFVPYSMFGEFGVDLFFVLSGFLITDILLKTKENKNYLRTFYIRRILRIFPIYYLTLTAFFILAPYCSQLQNQYSYYFNNQLFFWLYFQNWLPIIQPPPFLTNSILGHLWSLSVEEQFYIIWPFLILVCKKTKALIRICLLIIICFILFRFLAWLFLGNSNLTYWLQFNTRMDGLCIGSLIAVWRFTNVDIKSKILRWGALFIGFHIFIAIISKTVFHYMPHFSFLGYTSISIVFGISIVLAIEKKNKIINAVFELMPLRYIGKISYGLYLFHFPVLVVFKIYFADYIRKLGFQPLYSDIIIAVITALIAILISIFSYNFIEKKILRLKDKIAPVSLSSFISQKIIK